MKPSDKEIVLAKVRALTDDQLAYRLVQCQRMKDDPAFRRGAINAMQQRVGGLMTEERINQAEKNVRDVIEAEIKRRQAS